MDRIALADRYARVKELIPPTVELIAVSKTRSVEEIRALYDLGHRAFGENYPQELRDKHADLPGDIEWHFIGHLQSNKVKYIAPFVHLVHAVDSEDLLNELDKRGAAIGRTIDVLFQVHIAQEETKHGFSADELRALLGQKDIALRHAHVHVRGLMGMATNTEDRPVVENEFRSLARLFHETRANGPYPEDQFTELSMGMTGDMDIAIAAGSTMVRIGTAIFGERDH